MGCMEQKSSLFSLHMQAEAELVTGWLPHVRWVPADSRPGLQVPLPWLGSPSLTQAHLSILKAMHFDAQAATHNTVIQMRSWPMDTNSIEALQGLPAWAGQIWMELCTWPLKGTQYRRLGQAMPTSYQTWCIDNAPAAAMQSMCAAANRVRAGLGLPRLLVYSKEHQGEDRVWENVTLTGKWPQSEM